MKKNFKMVALGYNFAQLFVVTRGVSAVFCFSVCLVKVKSMIALSNHIKDTHAGVQIPGVIFFDTVAGK